NEISATPPTPAGVSKSRETLKYPSEKTSPHSKAPKERQSKTPEAQPEPEATTPYGREEPSPEYLREPADSQEQANRAAEIRLAQRKSGFKLLRVSEQERRATEIRMAQLREQRALMREQLESEQQGKRPMRRVKDDDSGFLERWWKP